MFTRSALSVVVVLVAALPSLAQGPWQFRWHRGLALTYKIKHLTSVVETLQSGKRTSASHLELVNRWQVTDLDSKGIATLSLTLVSMRNEQKRANGDVLLFDSENPDKNSPELHMQMSKSIGQIVAIVRMDKYGRVVEVKQGTAASFETEPPFLVVFPDSKAAGQTWHRQFKLALDPTLGAGEKFEAERRFECKKIEAGKATLGIATHFKTMPDNVRERLSLMQNDVQGELVFDLSGGRLLSAQLSTDKTIENHNGEGSSYQFQSQYSRQLTRVTQMTGSK